MKPSIRSSAIMAAAAALPLLLALCSSAAPPDELMVSVSSIATTVHDLLPEFGLPKGLLPSSVKSYSLSDDGKFEVELEKPCYVQFSNLVYYNTKITGKLEFGSIKDLTGIQAKKLFIWVSVTSIEVDDDSKAIEFYVGPLSEELPIKQFESIPTCRDKALSSMPSSSSFPCRGMGSFALPSVSEE